MPDRHKRYPPPRRVIVKFKDNVNLPYADGIGPDIEALEKGSWSGLEGQFPGIRDSRLYTVITPEQIAALVRRAQGQDSSYRPPNFLTYFTVDCPPEVEPAALVEVIRRWQSVQGAYPEPAASAPAPAPALDVNPGGYAFASAQGYLHGAESGIDANFALTISGGDGTGQSVIDLETGWTLDHEDFIANKPQLLTGSIDDACRGHGTSVLGVICGRRKGASPSAKVPGIIGIAPNVKDVNVVSYYNLAPVKPNRPGKEKTDPEEKMTPIADAIAYAAHHLEFGNVLVLEVQIDSEEDKKKDLPCEACEAIFEQIRLATSAGVVVVEAAGNGDHDLDAYRGTAMAGKGASQPIFDRKFQDSGAVLVAAASSGTHERTGGSNYGNRIDCYAWGDDVYTSCSNGSTDKTSRTRGFAGTSAAAAIVAGAALSVQGMNDGLGKGRFAPSKLRAILSDRDINTRASTGAAGSSPDDTLGVMPNLQAIYNKCIAP